MLYSKQALSFELQADLLLQRGLIANRDELIGRLRAVNYYRLTGYLYPFRQPNDAFAPNTKFEVIWRRYNFDRRLRILFLDVVERIEVSVRTQLVYHFVTAPANGPFGHIDPNNLPGFNAKDFQYWLQKLNSDQNRALSAHNPFVTHFEAKYGLSSSPPNHQYLPLWMACELMSCETVLRLAKGVGPSIIKQVATDYGFPDQQLLSWMKAVFTLRNACAHHARIWNSIPGVKPSIPGKNKNPLWHISPPFAHDRIGLVMTVCHHWLKKISPTTKWKQRLFTLFDEYPEIPLSEMGLPITWRTHPLWSDSSSVLDYSI